MATPFAPAPTIAKPTLPGAAPVTAAAPAAPTNGAIPFKYVPGAGATASANLPATPAAPAPSGLLPTIASNYGKDIVGAKDKIQSSVTDAAAKVAARDAQPATIGNELGKAGDLAEGGLGAAAGGVGAIFAPLAAPIQTLLAHTAKVNAGASDVPNKAINDQITSPEAVAARKQISDFVQAHPEAAKVIGDLFTVGTGALGGEASILEKPVSEVASTVKNGLANIPTAIKTGASDAASGIKAKVIPTSTPVDPTAAFIKDATPAYSKKLIGEPAVRTTAPDGTVTITPRIREAVGKNPFNVRDVTPTETETAAGKELSTVPNYPANGTALQKFNAIEPELTSRAQAIETSLGNENILRPPKEVAKIVRDAVNNASEESILLQKTDPIVKNYLRVAERAIADSDGTLKGEFQLRKALDASYEKAGGKYANDKGLDEIHRAARNALTDDVASKAKNTAVKGSLKSQSNLYKAADVLQDKAAAEGGSKFEQFGKAHPIIKKAGIGAAKVTGLGAGLHLLP